MNTKKFINVQFSSKFEEAQSSDHLQPLSELSLQIDKKNVSFKECSYVPSKIRPAHSMVGMKSLRPLKRHL